MTPSRSSELVEDHSHGPVIMLAISNQVGYTYVDASRADSEAGAGVEISRADGLGVEFTTSEEVEALIDALQVVKREVWG